MSTMPRTPTMIALALLLVAACGNTASSPPMTPSPPARETPVAEPPPGPAVHDAPATPALNAASSDTCQRDSDCTLSTAPECGSCCQCSPLHALTEVAERQRIDRCAATEFERPDCSREVCVPCGSVPASTHAVCRSGACVVAP